METTSIEVYRDGVTSRQKAPVFGRFMFYGETWVITPSTKRYHAHHLLDVEQCSLFSVTHEQTGIRVSPGTDRDSIDGARKAAKRFFKKKGRDAVRAAVKKPGLIPKENR